MRTGKRKGRSEPPGHRTGPRHRSRWARECVSGWKGRGESCFPNRGTNWPPGGWVEMGWWCQDTQMRSWTLWPLSKMWLSLRRPAGRSQKLEKCTLAFPASVLGAVLVAKTVITSGHKVGAEGNRNVSLTALEAEGQSQGVLFRDSGKSLFHASLRAPGAACNSCCSLARGPVPAVSGCFTWRLLSRCLLVFVSRLFRKGPQSLD